MAVGSCRDIRCSDVEIGQVENELLLVWVSNSSSRSALSEQVDIEGGFPFPDPEDDQDGSARRWRRP